ncbi:MAG: ABC transporter substrate-binding protein [Vallitalea sp.]|jgi:branched-chain amino acid transport system substrate-binding protein|nr:ABC transporter substrate-binding protein [Vallitalea sp.]
MKKRLLMIVSILICLVFVISGCGNKSTDADTNGDENTNAESSNEEVVKIGLITAETGDIAQYGMAVENAVKLAADEINTAGGIDGKKIKLVIYDNKGDAQESVTLFRRLVNNDKIDALIGPVISGTTLAVAPLAEESEIPMITPTATALNVTPEYEYVFRACYTDPYQGTILAKYALKELDAKNIAILYNTGSDYSAGLAEVFKGVAEDGGAKIVNYVGYTNDDVDFNSVLTNVKANEPDLIFIPDYYNKVGVIATTIKELGIDATLLGPDGWDGVQEEYIDVVEGGYFGNHYYAGDESKIVKDFVKTYTDKYSETPNALAALGYDAMKIMANAIDKADSTNNKKILEQIKLTSLDLVTGHITFDENGDTTKSVTIINVEDGELKLKTKFSDN